jgi:hypothetical protein
MKCLGLQKFGGEDGARLWYIDENTSNCGSTTRDKTSIQIYITLRAIHILTNDNDVLEYERLQYRSTDTLT